MKHASFVALGMLIGLLHAAPPAEQVWTDPAKAAEEDPDFSIQGEYGKDGPGADWALQVVALGSGKFDGYLLEGGLPGLGWERGKRRLKASGSREGGVTVLKGSGVEARIEDGKATVSVDGGVHELPSITRRSPTEGAKPPAGAVVLFDGTSADAWTNGKMEGDLLVNADAISKRTFGDYTLHLEFRTPYKPQSRGQRRGNSGVYHQGRYETQVLDSFGLEGQMNETGGIYSIAAPRLNMCLPPLTWQTYDVEFIAPRWEGDKKVKNGRITVRLNGVLVQEDQELTHSTPAAKFKEEPGPGPIYLQHHGNPVRYRNIWVVPKD